MGRNPGKRVMAMEAISGECSPQGVANTLRAYERMGRKPGKRMSEIIYFKRGANEELI